MKRLFLSLCVLALAAGAAQANPLKPKTTDRFKLVLSSAAGFLEDGTGVYDFDAKSYTNVDGSRAGAVFVSSFSYTTGYSSVQCFDLPELADAVVLNQSTGAVTINATIDPTKPGCFASFNYSGGPLTVSLTGRFDGTERFSESGTITRQILGYTEKMNYQGENFRNVFVGSTGFTTGQFAGNAVYGRSTNRTRIK